MPHLALAQERGTVDTDHLCDEDTVTLEGSSTVFGPGGYKIVRKGDKEKEISQGQAHCLGLSYIAGIRRITKRNYFMMVDSPFHNISQESKLSICVELPTKMDTTQVTLFTTDTEYLAEIKKSEFTKGSKSAREVLKENKLVGREYNLVDNIFAEIEGEKYRDVKIERIS